MLWTKENYPIEMKDLSPELREKAIELGNMLIKDSGMEEGEAVAIAISQAEEWATTQQGEK